MKNKNSEFITAENAVENIQILPNQGLSLFKFGLYINDCIILLKKLSIVLDKYDIYASNNNNSPLIIHIKNSGIKLRFDNFYQKLELIDISFSNQYYNNKNRLSLFFNDKQITFPNKNYVLSYNDVCSILDINSMPLIIDNGNKLLLKSHGISFIFLNSLNYEDFSEIQQNGSLILLHKILIFNNNLLKDSLADINKINYNINRLNFDTNYINNLENVQSNIIIYVNLNRIEIKLNRKFSDYKNKSNTINNNNNINNNSIKIENSNFNSNNKSDINIFNKNKNNNYNILSKLEIFNKENEDDVIIIQLEDSLDTILNKLENPTYITFKKLNYNEKNNNPYLVKENINIIKDVINNNNISSSNIQNLLQSLNINNNAKNLLDEIINVHVVNYETNSSDNCTDFFLNYINIGIDLLIDHKTLTLKKIIIHNNNPLSPYFSYYKRANFILKLDNNFFRPLNNEESPRLNSNANNNQFSDSRKNSEASNPLNINDLSVDNDYKISKIDNIYLSKNNVHYNECNNSVIINDNISLTNNYNNNKSLNNYRKISINNNLSNKNLSLTNISQTNNYSYNNININNKNRRSKYDNDVPFNSRNTNLNNKQLYYPNIKINKVDENDSYNSNNKDIINESQLSFNALNPNEFLWYILLKCNTNFNKEVLSKINSNTYQYYRKTDSKTGVLSNYYIFDYFGFEVMENNMIETITLYYPSFK